MDRVQIEKIKEIRAFFLKGLSPHGGTFLVASIADVITDGLTVDETVALASFLGSISQLMAYIAAQTTINKGSKQVKLSIEDNTVTLRGI
jgi:hypothetical protein